MRGSLIDFLATGRLGNLDLGVSLSKFETRRGEPDAVGGGSQRYPRPSIYLYGTVEFWFGSVVHMTSRVPTGKLSTKASSDFETR